LALQGVSPEALVRAFPTLELPEARKLVSHIHRSGALPKGMAGVRRESMAWVRERTHVPTLRVVREQASAEDPFVKYALETHDAHVVETVRIPLERAGRYSVCVSSQVGCALACAFCATGRMGLRRNLEAWEIVEQVRIVRAGLAADSSLPGKSRVHGVVFQGMGEPMANLDRVLQAIAVLTDPSALAIDGRNITVCTSGLPSGIRRLATEVPNVRLGLSLGSARAEVRRRIMPIANTHGMDEIFDAAVFHAKTTGLAPMWAVTPLAGVNDSDDDARALSELATRFAEASGVRPRISVIPYNAISADDDPFRRTELSREIAFRDAIRAGGFGSHKRYSGGADVDAACGQLAAKV